MDDTDTAWEIFRNNGFVEKKKKQDNFKCSPKPPESTPIYISTQTKIGFLNTQIPLNEIFWKIPVIPYYLQKKGIIKKEMKIVCLNKDETKALDENIKHIKWVDSHIIKYVDNPNAHKIKYKDIRKISIGLSKKDMISYRKKKKGAFYNCVVCMVRIVYMGNFREFHVKVFNTGKLEIPGIQNDTMLDILLNELIINLQPFFKKKLICEKNKIETVLINSNFSCNYFINRDKLYDILKYKYKLYIVYDPCSYPGIQCKFYYNTNNTKNDGVCYCSEKCNKKGKGTGNNQCMELSFMIFRTGSVLIVGHCTEPILQKIYLFIKKILIVEYPQIFIKNNTTIKKKKKKKRKKIIITCS